MTEDAPVDRQELASVVWELLRDAKSQPEIDHQACKGYADILFKLLPVASGPKASENDLLEQARSAIQNEQQAKAAAKSKP